jgi:glycosyltransferase involved in cell wall biosynthesis
MLAVAFLICQVILLFLAKPRPVSKGFWLPLLLALPFLFYTLSLSYSNDLYGGYKYVERTILLVVLPFLLYFNRSTISRSTLHNSLRFLALTMSLLSVYVIASMFLSGTFQEAALARDAYYIIRTKLESLSGLHPTYFSLLIALPLLSQMRDLKQKGLNKTERFFSFSACIIFLVALVIASSKMILFATLLGALILLSEGLSWKAILLRFSLVSMLALLLVFSVRPLKERVFTLVSALEETEVEEHNPDSMRKAIYQCTWELIGENPILGTGIGDAQLALNQKYEAHNYSLAKERGFNTHNQYLQLWLSVGIFPFMLFILSLIAQFLIAFIKQNSLHIAFAVLISLSFLSENLLARQDGVFAYVFFSSMFCYASWSLKAGRVFINGRYLSQELTGVQRFSDEIVNYLLKFRTESILLTIPGLKSTVKQIHPIPFVKVNGQLWEQVILPVYLKLNGSPLLVNLGNSAPVLYANSIVCLHDVAFKKQPQWFAPNFVRWYNFMVPRILKSARHIITVSEFSKKEIMYFYTVADSQVSVLYNGKPRFTLSADKADNKVEGDYALCVGSLSERKNQLYLIEAYLQIENPSFKLVLAGSINAELFKEQAELMSRIKSSANIHLIESPSDNDLSTLYSQAKFCVYVPLYEGFGIPVLEAIAYKKPIVVSDIPVFRELFSDYVLFSSLSNNDNLRAKLEEMNSSAFQWGKVLLDFNFEERGFSYRASAEKLNELINDTINAKDC